MRHLITVVEDLRGRSIGFRSLNEGAIDTTGASDELIFNIFSALAQFERRLIQERTKAGLATARARGRNGGRPRILAKEARVLATKKLFGDKSIPISENRAYKRLSKHNTAILIMDKYLRIRPIRHGARLCPTAFGYASEGRAAAPV
jgi:DNA invertase Pin-like site-specific DNA recombinase